jgi:hypothetical protein
MLARGSAQARSAGGLPQFRPDGSTDAHTGWYTAPRFAGQAAAPSRKQER